MSSRHETIPVRLVPMADEDEQALGEAISLLTALRRLLGEERWEGCETIDGLQRIFERVRYHGWTWDIPLPVSRETRKPLFVRIEEENE